MGRSPSPGRRVQTGVPHSGHVIESIPQGTEAKLYTCAIMGV